ncbi:hypothetical protein GOV04_04470 [Candidatus Woesearchaeota archaeon]|nr:hypothetical protein [Candidatus Woesearchaeota archaeon]
MVKAVKSDNPFVAIGASLGGIFLVIAVVFIFLAKEFLTHLVSIAWAFVAIAVTMGFFALLAIKKEK